MYIHEGHVCVTITIILYTSYDLSKIPTCIPKRLNTHRKLKCFEISHYTIEFLYKQNNEGYSVPSSKSIPRLSAVCVIHFSALCDLSRRYSIICTCLASETRFLRDCMWVWSRGKLGTSSVEEKITSKLSSTQTEYVQLKKNIADLSIPRYCSTIKELY